MIYTIKLLLLVCISASTAIAEETKIDKLLEHLSQREYRKSYENLTTIEKEKIVQNYDKRKRIYALARAAELHNSSAYKEYMQMVGKEYAMRLFLQKHRDSIVVPLKDIQSYYDAHIQDYTSVHAFTLVRKNKKELDAYLKILASTDDAKLMEAFTALAKQHSQHPRKDKGGDMGFIGYTTIAKPFGKEAFSLKDNTYTTHPFRTVLGWHIVYVKERKIIPFKEVKKKIEDTLKFNIYKKWFSAL